MRNIEEGAIFWDEIENFNCSHLARRDRDFGSIILMFRDEIEITYCYSHVSRRERETQIEFLKVKREKSQSILKRTRILADLWFGVRMGRKTRVARNPAALKGAISSIAQPSSPLSKQDEASFTCDVRSLCCLRYRRRFCLYQIYLWLQLLQHRRL